MNSLLSAIIHNIFVASCDFCKKELKGKDFNRICLRCAAQLENTRNTPTCVNCFQPLKPLISLPSDQKNTCDECSLAGSSLSINRSLFFNYGIAQRLIYDFKFKPHSSYAPIVIYWSMKKLQDYLNSFDLFVPIPLGKKGLYEREFCQVTKVTRGLAKAFKKPMLKIIVRNEKNYGQAQHQLTAKEREAAIKEKYLYLPRYRDQFEKKKILVIDDIYTTGSTLKNAARLIMANNKNTTVGSFTFLRTTLDKPEDSQTDLQSKI